MEIDIMTLRLLWLVAGASFALLGLLFTVAVAAA